MIKHVIKKLAYHSGLFKVSSWKNRNMLTILFYHGFSHRANNKEGKNSNAKHLNIEEFEKHLKLFKKYCTPISLKEAVLNEKLPANPIVLTFDDGYKNNYSYAFPLLKKYRVPATIFITTGFIDQTNFLWTDRLEFIIDNTHCKSRNFQCEDDNLILELCTDNEKMQTIRSIKKYLKALPESKKLSFLDRLQQFLEIEYNWDKIPSLLMPLTWDEIREMKESGLISIGSHTVTHPILSKCSCEQQRKELMLSQKRIVEELNQDCNLFAYPNGKFADYNQDTIRLLKELDYLGAVTTVDGYIDISNRDSLQLDRFGYEKTVEDMAVLISRFYHLVGHI